MSDTANDLPEWPQVFLKQTLADKLELKRLNFELNLKIPEEALESLYQNRLLFIGDVAHRDLKTTDELLWTDWGNKPRRVESTAADDEKWGVFDNFYDLVWGANLLPERDWKEIRASYSDEAIIAYTHKVCSL